jgi:hypothetical protein
MPSPDLAVVHVRWEDAEPFQHPCRFRKFRHLTRGSRNQNMIVARLQRRLVPSHAVPLLQAATAARGRNPGTAASAQRPAAAHATSSAIAWTDRPPCSSGPIVAILLGPRTLRARRAERRAERNCCLTRAMRDWRGRLGKNVSHFRAKNSVKSIRRQPVRWIRTAQISTSTEYEGDERRSRARALKNAIIFA